MGTTRCPFFTVMPSLPAWMPGWIKNLQHTGIAEPVVGAGHHVGSRDAWRIVEWYS